MPQIVSTLKNEDGLITGLLTAEDDVIRPEELATMIEQGRRVYVDFGEDDEFDITLIGQEDELEPGFFDPNGNYSMDSLPSRLDPRDEEYDDMMERMERDGEFEPDEDRRVPDDRKDRRDELESET